MSYHACLEDTPPLRWFEGPSYRERNPLPPRRPSLMYGRVIPNPIIGNREPSALGNGGATFDDHAANRFSAASNLAGSIFDTSTPASTAALATWRPSFAAGRGTSSRNIAAADLVDPLDHLFRDRGGLVSTRAKGGLVAP